jgi:putative ABC transport system permease protein
MRLLRALILRPLRRDRLRTTLTVFSVALGVAVVVAIDLAGEAATGSFRSSLVTLVGNTDLEIAANGGIDETWIARLAALPLNARFAPVLETQAEIPRVGSFPLYGVDTVALSSDRPASGLDRSAGLLLSQSLYTRLRQPGRLTLLLDGRPQTFPIAGPLPAAPGVEFLALDIADAQQALGAYGRLDRIDVYLSPREDLSRAERAIRALLPPGYSLDKPGARSAENQRMLRAFRWNLRVLSYISLVVGAFLIYNTIAVSVVRRRAEIGILRALGATRAGVFWLFLAEALMFGLLGSLAGVLLGRLLASSIVGLIAATVNSLYTSSRPAPVTLDLSGFLAGILAGATVALVSAFAPAREAMRVSPTEAMGRGAYEHHARLR